MRIVAVRALHQVFVDPVMERHVELRLLLQVARVTKFRLRLSQQVFFGFRMMDRVAGNAAHIAEPMH